MVSEASTLATMAVRHGCSIWTPVTKQARVPTSVTGSGGRASPMWAATGKALSMCWTLRARLQHLLLHPLQLRLLHQGLLQLPDLARVRRLARLRRTRQQSYRYWECWQRIYEYVEH